MKNVILFLLVILFFQNCSNPNPDPNFKPTSMEHKETEKNDKPLLRHVVLFKFKDDAEKSAIEKVENGFRALPTHIPEIKGFEWGTNNSPEGLDQGFTHCFFVSFADEAGRDVYLPHPKHKEFVEILKPILDKGLVLDYWAKN